MSTEAQRGPAPGIEPTVRRTTAGRDARSYLVRVWLEPREIEGAEPVLRASVRDLRTGRDRLVADAGVMYDEMLRDLLEG